MSVLSGWSMVMKRKELKAHGTGQSVEGDWKRGQSCLIVEDVVTTGSSIIETVQVSARFLNTCSSSSSSERSLPLAANYASHKCGCVYVSCRLCAMRASRWPAPSCCSTASRAASRSCTRRASTCSPRSARARCSKHCAAARASRTRLWTPRSASSAPRPHRPAQRPPPLLSHLLQRYVRVRFSCEPSTLQYCIINTVLVFAS